MKIKMKEDVVGVKGDGGESMHYHKGNEHRHYQVAVHFNFFEFFSIKRTKRQHANVTVKKLYDMKEKMI